jgi:hypothetical protein
MLRYDTMYNSATMGDDVQRVQCSHCKKWFVKGDDKIGNMTVSELTELHREVCEGDPDKTLQKVADLAINLGNG